MHSLCLHGQIACRPWNVLALVCGPHSSCWCVLPTCCAQTATDYGSYLANEASPLYTSTIVDRCTQKLVEDWNAMRCQVRDRAACLRAHVC
jgi:hypothetical protein